MLNNNIKILLVLFVHHIELQNFLNAPRIYCMAPLSYGWGAIANIDDMMMMMTTMMTINYISPA